MCGVKIISLHQAIVVFFLLDPASSATAGRFCDAGVRAADTALMAAASPFSAGFAVGWSQTDTTAPAARAPA